MILEFPYREIECGAGAFITLIPDLAMVEFDDFFADSQTYAGTVILIVSMQPFKHLEDLC